MTIDKYNELVIQQTTLEKAIAQANEQLQEVKRQREEAERTPIIRQKLDAERASIPQGFVRRD